MTYLAGSKAIAQVLLEKIVPLRQAYPDRIFVFCALGQPEVLRQYEDAGIPSASDFTVKSAEDAKRAAEKIGFPVVTKNLSPDTLHKSDIGTVKLNVDSAEAVHTAYDAILSAVGPPAPAARAT